MIGNNLATLRMSGNWLIFARLCATHSADDLRFLGDNPSRPVALLVSNCSKAHLRLAAVICGILNLMFSGVRELT